MADSNELGATTIMMYIFFTINSILYLSFYLIKQEINKISNSNKQIQDDDIDIITTKKEKKELSKPFVGTIDCFYNLTSELFRTSLILLLTFICEKHWIFPHSQKTYSRDLFMFILILFFAYAFYTIKPVHDLTLLSREQTEEWKGWMQFIFLLYHYFHAEEVYNSVRVMITCYVWMTGFGNFSFFYVKGDFGWLRVIQMLWRLNFSVVLLMWTHGNTWILYYICPMHTFYFLMVYTIMYTYHSVNHSKWGIRAKLLLFGFAIYLIWDVNQGLFDFLFAWLGTNSVIGAPNGSVWEYYFRTSLDHWSSFLGMIFALNFPIGEQFFSKAQGGPLYVAAAIFFILFICWFKYIYLLEKFSYNLYHSYFAILPLTAYIFFRNITPFVRSYVSMSLHDLGKTTLETYLLQHHIWLTSNAKTLLTIIPGNPWVNFALATVLFFTVAKELYRVTMSLRGMILPDDEQISKNNIIGMIAIFSSLYGMSYLLYIYQSSLFEITLATFLITIVTFIAIYLFNESTNRNPVVENWFKRVGLALLVLVVLGIILNYTVEENISSSYYTLYGNKFEKPTSDCLSAVSSGEWIVNDCELTDTLCKTTTWQWTNIPDHCPIKPLTSNDCKYIYNNKQVVMIGDGIMRNTYHQLNKLIDPSYDKIITNSTFKHTDLSNKIGSIQLQFVWAPRSNDISDYLHDNKRELISQYLVLGSNLWDALYDENDVEKYITNLNKISHYIPSANNSNSPTVIWLHPTKIITERLNSEDKTSYMSETIISNYRNALSQADELNAKLYTAINPLDVCIGKEISSNDGVYYDEDVYKIIAQMIGNAFALHTPSFYNQKPVTKKSKPKPTGSMSFPNYGIFVLIISAIMLVTFDAFLGVGFISLTLFNRSFDWEEAFIPLHKKLGIDVPRDHAAVQLDASEGEFLLQDIKPNKSKV